MTVALGLTLLALGGCVTKGGSKMDVKRIDGNTFELTGHMLGSLSGQAALQADNDKVAAAFCAEKNKPMSVVERHGFGGMAPQDVLTFRCGGPAAVVATQKPTKPTKGT